MDMDDVIGVKTPTELPIGPERNKGLPCFSRIYISRKEVNANAFPRQEVNKLAFNRRHSTSRFQTWTHH